jgi:inhibitor of cysteine peptidase
MSNVREEVSALMIFLILATMPVAVVAAPNEADCMKVISENYDGKTIRVIQGESFCLKLKENPSTGYSWEISLSKGLGLVSSEYYPLIPSNNVQKLIVGTAGLHLWKFKAIARGDQQVKGIYRRSWERKICKEQTFRLSIKVI